MVNLDEEEEEVKEEGQASKKKSQRKSQISDHSTLAKTNDRNKSRCICNYCERIMFVVPRHLRLVLCGCI